MMPIEQLKKFEDDLLALKSCFALAAEDLKSTPVCPHCNYRPALEGASGSPARLRLNALDDGLDRMLDEWGRTLRNNLADPTVAPNIDLLPVGDGRTLLEGFAAGGQLPEPVSDAFVRALREVLGGLQKVAVTGDGLSAALSEGGLPCTLDQARERLNTYLDALASGRDRARVRLVVD
jgi:hypothetical protein